MTRGFIWMLSAMLALSKLAASEEATFSQALGQSPVASIEASVLKERGRIARGQPFWLAIDLHFPKGVRSGWFLPLGDWPATRLSLHLPEPLEIRQIQWPLPQLDLSRSPALAYYEGSITVLVELFWKSDSALHVPDPLMQAQLQVQGQARWSGVSHHYAFHRLVMLPSLLLPGEPPLPLEPLTQSAFDQARKRLPELLDPALVDWKVGQGLQVTGKNLSSQGHWWALAYHTISKEALQIPTESACLTHQKIGDKDQLDLPMKMVQAWKKAGVDQILLLNDHTHEGLLIALTGDETINYSLVEQLSSWYEMMLMQLSGRL